MIRVDERPVVTPRCIRVAWYEPIVRHYRIPLVNRVAATESIELTLFATQDTQGTTNADALECIDAPVVRLRFAPLHRARLPLDYTVGWTRILQPRHDVVTITEATRNVVNWLLLALRRPFGYRVIVMGHIRLTHLDARYLTPLRRRLVSAADGVIAYGESGRRQGLEWGIPPSAAIAIGNTIDVDGVARARAAVSEDAIGELRTRLQLDGPTFLFIARPTPWKRLDVAIDAVRLLRDRGVRAHLLVVGSGSELSRYMAYAAGIDTIHFLGGLTDEASLAPIFAVSDLVLIPGAVGLAVNHAFAYGLPLVSSQGVRHGPEMELAEHGTNSWLVETCDAEQFAEALAGLVADPPRLARLREGAVATNVPTIDTMVEHITALVKRIANSKRKP